MLPRTRAAMSSAREKTRPGKSCSSFRVPQAYLFKRLLVVISATMLETEISKGQLQLLCKTDTLFVASS